MLLNRKRIEKEFPRRPQFRSLAAPGQALWRDIGHAEAAQQEGFRIAINGGFHRNCKISKTTPCKVADGRRNRRFEPILDTSGKSAAFFIIAKSVKMTAGAQRRLFDVTSGETPSSMIGRSIETASMH
jgi:hypothetical protein